MKTVLLDRDGVINPLLDFKGEKISPQSLEEFKLYPDVEEVIELLKEEGYQVLVFTNQPDVDKNWRKLTKEDLNDINCFLEGIGVDNVYTCKHGPKGDKENKYYRENGEIVVCDCRKPQPGLIEQAAEENKIFFSESFVIGDKTSDLEAAERYEEENNVEFKGKLKIGKKSENADRTFDNLYQTIDYIIGEES